MRIFLILTAAFFLAIVITGDVRAFEATSTNFEIHAGSIGSISGIGTSSNFGVTGAGGQTAVGLASNIKKELAGILYWLYNIFTPSYEQIHYRWRNDDGNEQNAGWAANEDAQLNNLSKNTIKRLRFAITNKGWTRGSVQTFRIEYALTNNCASGFYTALVTDSSLDWQIADSANLTDGNPTTNVSGGLTDENAFFVAGQVKDTGNQTAAIAVTSENFTEIEYSIKATGNAADSGNYCFRLTNAGSATNFVYTKYAVVSLAAAPPPPPPSPPGGGGGPSIIETRVVFSGRSYPKSAVTLLKDAQIAATTIADTNANFSVTISGLSAGNYIFSVYSEDNKGNRSSLLTFPASVTSGVTTNIGGIFIAPTIAVDKSEVKRGDNIAIFGQTVAGAEVTISINSEQEIFIKRMVDAQGAYLLNFDSSVLEMGQHHTKSKSAYNGEITAFGRTVAFIVGTRNILAQLPKKIEKGDLNNDNRVNLVDFSIAVYWYKKSLSETFRLIEAERLSGDGKVDLVDFSILAYYWTG